MKLPEAPDRALVAQQLSDSTLAEETTVPSLPHALDGLRVLVVDDEAGVGTLITALLESHGIEVKAVTSSAAALKEIEQFQPDILLSDIRLPGSDGYDLIRQIRALEARQGRHIPAAAITAYLDEDREKALSAGFEAYWYKLSQPTELVEVVIQMVERATNDQS
jgi:CheY-like chemotaxis protein